MRFQNRFQLSWLGKSFRRFASSQIQNLVFKNKFEVHILANFRWQHQLISHISCLLNSQKPCKRVLMTLMFRGRNGCLLSIQLVARARQSNWLTNMFYQCWMKPTSVTRKLWQHIKAMLLTWLKTSIIKIILALPSLEVGKRGPRAGTEEIWRSWDSTLSKSLVKVTACFTRV